MYCKKKFEYIHMNHKVVLYLHNKDCVLLLFIFLNLIKQVLNLRLLT